MKNNFISRTRICSARCWTIIANFINICLEFNIFRQTRSDQTTKSDSEKI